MLLRISFGLSALFVGIDHYRDFANFSQLVVVGLPTSVAQLALIWAFIYPALLIVGGVLFCFCMVKRYGMLLLGIAFASVPAGMLLKTAFGGMGLDQTMPAAMNAWLWIIVFMFLIKNKCGMSACGGGMCMPSKECCDKMGNCDCGPMMSKKPMPAAKPAAKKATTSAPKAMTKKKPAAKKKK